ncbi:MAG: 50S ribosomal protein L32 [Deltaproteobacteria bacterium]|nr:50S ribosomal protein L32 [Deltaproteobacteria bacterium]
MPVPKRKKSRARRNNRRAHDALTAPSLSPCPHCKEPKLSHRVCLHCGYYRGEEIIPMEAKK